MIESARTLLPGLRWLALGACSLALAACSKDVSTGRRCLSGDNACEASAHAGSGANSAAASGTGGGAGAAGMGSVMNNDNALTVHVEDIEEMTIEIVTLACAGDCADIEAVAQGGHPPYTFEWEDGSTDPMRHVCLDESTELTVSATDTTSDAEEFEYEAKTVSTEVTARVLECADAGVCVPGAGPDTPDSGHYEGTGMYVCDNDTDPAVAMTINHLIVSLDFVIDEDEVAQTGHAYFQWGLVIIAGVGDLEGVLECGGQVRAGLVNGTWGLPGAEPMTVLATGGVTGEFTAKRAADAGMITGTWHWTSTLPTGEVGNQCMGTYEAHLVPP